MALAESKITSQGQISVPAEVRRKLGVGPGSTLVWEQDGEEIVVRRAKKSTSLDIHRALFPDGPPKRKSLAGMKEAIRQHFVDERARGRY